MQTPIKLRTYTHPHSRGTAEEKNWKTKEKARTRRQKKIQGRWELVANAGDRSSLMTRRGTHHCLPLLHPQRYRQFSLPVWLRDPRLLLILLLPTIDRLNQAHLLLLSSALYSNILSQAWLCSALLFKLHPNWHFKIFSSGMNSLLCLSWDGGELTLNNWGYIVSISLKRGERFVCLICQPPP